jgi:hypothetical protein
MKMVVVVGLVADVRRLLVVKKIRFREEGERSTPDTKNKCNTRPVEMQESAGTNAQLFSSPTPQNNNINYNPNTQQLTTQPTPALCILFFSFSFYGRGELPSVFVWASLGIWFNLRLRRPRELGDRAFPMAGSPLL